MDNNSLFVVIDFLGFNDDFASGVAVFYGSDSLLGLIQYDSLGTVGIDQSVSSHTRDLLESVFGALYPSPTELLRGALVGGGKNHCGIFRHRRDLAQGLAPDQIYHQVGSVWRNGSYSLGG